MSLQSRIEWTDATWNPITGCTKISKGCANCYAERIANWLKSINRPNYANGFDLTLHPHMLPKPIYWKKPQRIFVNSMSDTFHEDVPFQFIENIFQIMQSAYWHTFMVLTKRSSRLLKYSNRLPWPNNVWAGVTVECKEYIYRIEDLKQTPAKIKFVSFEPLIGPIYSLKLDGIDWVIVGGESGPGARRIDPDWVRYIRDICHDINIPFFFKQWGGIKKKRTGRVIDGETWDEHPLTEPSIIQEV